VVAETVEDVRNVENGKASGMEPRGKDAAD
jgi:hypothetical protein